MSNPSIPQFEDPEVPDIHETENTVELSVGELVKDLMEVYEQGPSHVEIVPGLPLTTFAEERRDSLENYFERYWDSETVDEFALKQVQEAISGRNLIVARYDGVDAEGIAHMTFIGLTEGASARGVVADDITIPEGIFPLVGKTFIMQQDEYNPHYFIDNKPVIGFGEDGQPLPKYNGNMARIVEDLPEGSLVCVSKGRIKNRNYGFTDNRAIEYSRGGNGTSMYGSWFATKIPVKK